MKNLALVLVLRDRGRARRIYRDGPRGQAQLDRKEIPMTDTDTKQDGQGAGMRIAELERDLGLVRTYLSNTASVLNATKAENATLSARVKALEEALRGVLKSGENSARVRANKWDDVPIAAVAYENAERALTSPNPSAEKGAD